MAPKGFYTGFRLREIAAKASDKAKAAFPACDILKCSYAGGDECLTSKSKVRFEWTVDVNGHTDKLSVEMMCCSAFARGVRYPEHWRTAIHCALLGETIAKSVQKLQDFNGVSATLSILGVPKHSQPPSLGASLVPGAVAQLQTRTRLRQDYLLAAHIDRDRRAGHNLFTATI